MRYCVNTDGEIKYCNDCPFGFLDNTGDYDNEYLVCTHPELPKQGFEAARDYEADLKPLKDCPLTVCKSELSFESMFEIISDGITHGVVNREEFKKFITQCTRLYFEEDWS